MTIAELLQKSRDAHTRYRHAAGHIDRVGGIKEIPNTQLAREAIIDAMEFRNQAHKSDPLREDAAWAVDAVANKGQSSETMLRFFRSFFVSEP